jgi:hypothetical protein
MTALRSVIAVIAGLLLISLIVEPLEFALVALVHGEPTTDPEIYSSVRNRPLFLAAKLVYNTLAAVAGGFVAARLAPRAPIHHAIALVIVQTAAFAYAIATPEMRRTTPDPIWVCLFVLTAIGIMGGAHLQRRMRAKAPVAPAGRAGVAG